MSEPPADILRRLRPIPTYTDHPTTTPHDVVGVAPDGTVLPGRRGGGRRAGSAPVPLGGLPRLPGPLGGPAELHAGLAGAARLVVVTRSPGEESPEAITALAGDAPAPTGSTS